MKRSLFANSCLGEYVVDESSASNWKTDYILDSSGYFFLVYSNVSLNLLEDTFEIQRNANASQM